MRRLVDLSEFNIDDAWLSYWLEDFPSSRLTRAMSTAYKYLHVDADNLSKSSIYNSNEFGVRETLLTAIVFDKSDVTETSMSYTYDGESGLTYTLSTDLRYDSARGLVKIWVINSVDVSGVKFCGVLGKNCLSTDTFWLNGFDCGVTSDNKLWLSTNPITDNNRFTDDGDLYSVNLYRCRKVAEAANAVFKLYGCDKASNDPELNHDWLRFIQNIYANGLTRGSLLALAGYATSLPIARATSRVVDVFAWGSNKVVETTDAAYVTENTSLGVGDELRKNQFIDSTNQFKAFSTCLVSELDSSPITGSILLAGDVMWKLVNDPIITTSSPATIFTVNSKVELMLPAYPLDKAIKLELQDLLLDALKVSTDQELLEMGVVVKHDYYEVRGWSSVEVPYGTVNLKTFIQATYTYSIDAGSGLSLATGFLASKMPGGLFKVIKAACTARSVVRVSDKSVCGSSFELTAVKNNSRMCRNLTYTPSTRLQLQPGTATISEAVTDRIVVL